MPQVIGQTEDMIIVEDDGGFVNFIPKQKKFAPRPELTLEEQEEISRKLDEAGIYMF